MKLFVRLLMLALLLALPGEEAAMWQAPDDEDVITGYGGVALELVDHDHAAPNSDPDPDGSDFLFQRQQFIPPLARVAYFPVAPDLSPPTVTIGSLFRPPRA